ncbi:hypothetical protein D3C86_2130810 [compost metagenome]
MISVGASMVRFNSSVSSVSMLLPAEALIGGLPALARATSPAKSFTGSFSVATTTKGKVLTRLMGSQLSAGCSLVL